MSSAPKETTLMGALVDAVFGSSAALASPSAVISEQEIIETESFLQPNEDGLVVEFCTTFATEASETVAVVPPTTAAAALVTENNILTLPPVAAVASATETTTGTTTTGQSSSTPPTDSSEQDEEEPMKGFLSRFFQPRKNRTESADTSKEFHIEEIAIADDSKDEYDEELETSTMEDSNDDESECSDSNSKQSFIYEAASTMDHRSATPFWGSSTSSFSVAEQSAVTSRASSVSSESRDAYNDFESRASSLSYAETRDDCDTALGSISSETTTFDEEDYESIAEMEEQGNGVEVPQTVTLKVSELMANATNAEEATKPNSILPKPALKKLNQMRKWFPWQVRSKRGSKRSSSGGSRTLEVIVESEEDEVMSMIESMNIDESDVPSTKRKTQSEDFDSNKKKYKTAASPQAGEALSHFGVEWEMISFNSKSHKRLMPWSRRLSAKDKKFVAIENERAEL